MSPHIKIRQASEHDLPFLLRLEEAAFSKDRFTHDQMEYLLTRSRATTFLLELSGQPAGAAIMLWRNNLRLARLYNIAIDPTIQSRGLGSKLLKACEREAVLRGCDRISLEVREDNTTGIRFYEKHGYTIERAMPDYYSDGMTGLKMARSLAPGKPLSLRLDVPYYAQTLDFTCGPACLMMTLKYFNPRLELTRALEMQLWKEATLIFMASGFGGTDGYGLSLAAFNRGLRGRIVMSMDTTPMLKSVRTQQKREVMRIVHRDMKRRARNAGLAISVYQYGIEEIISALHRGYLPIVMISTYRLTGDRVPHWVIVTGHDERNIYIHDPDIASYRKNRARARNIKIDKDEFLKMSRYGKEVYRCLLTLAQSSRPQAKPTPR
ncbi:MAG TPA: GNAT family N-acetyltransferase/peptidase C39 family protein [candidate division Zixibacteria bacterium]|nr:GNAT family N-acetyltransferase/peptidase C39 family protein [candidate division Zixibacteria bacterium]